MLLCWVSAYYAVILLDPECWINQMRNAKHKGLLKNLGTDKCYNPGSSRERKQDGGVF